MRVCAINNFQLYVLIFTHKGSSRLITEDGIHSPALCLLSLLLTVVVAVVVAVVAATVVVAAAASAAPNVGCSGGQDQCPSYVQMQLSYPNRPLLLFSPCPRVHARHERCLWHVPKSRGRTLSIETKEDDIERFRNEELSVRKVAFVN